MESQQHYHRNRQNTEHVLHTGDPGGGIIQAYKKLHYSPCESYPGHYNRC